MQSSLLPAAPLIPSSNPWLTKVQVTECRRMRYEKRPGRTVTYFYLSPFI